jgi:hypothetical protein
VKSASHESGHVNRPFSSYKVSELIDEGVKNGSRHDESGRHGSEPAEFLRFKNSSNDNTTHDIESRRALNEEPEYDVSHEDQISLGVYGARFFFDALAGAVPKRFLLLYVYLV